MDLKLGGKIAIITGGSVGIGLAAAKGLAAEGVHLALCARNEARLGEESERRRSVSAPPAGSQCRARPRVRVVGLVPSGLPTQPRAGRSRWRWEIGSGAGGRGAPWR